MIWFSYQNPTGLSGFYPGLAKRRLLASGNSASRGTDGLAKCMTIEAQFGEKLRP
jgi:hypothetical protein